ncbi:MAG: hypothetical protein KDC98_26200, partial [Planctomycetes bacterium]|nr:hypothetical protein [Planctomycetota bacterium]
SVPPVVHDGTVAPEQAGGLERWKTLEVIDGHCERFPRVDFIEFTNRINRRMAREVAGIRARGLPSWWASRLQSMSKAAEDPVPAGSVRIFRIPMGGWLIGTSEGGFAIDPSGADIAEWLWGRMEFAILTQPLDSTRRNDELLKRMLMSKPPRPVLTHIAFHLPVIVMSEVPLVTLGEECGPPKGIKVRALGRALADGSVPGSCSYRIEIDGGPRLMFVAPALRESEVTTEPVDVMLLSPRNADLPRIVAKVKPGLVLLDEGFLCQSMADFPRVSLRDLLTIQKALQPTPSLLLAPGESWDVTRGK